MGVTLMCPCVFDVALYSIKLKNVAYSSHWLATTVVGYTYEVISMQFVDFIITLKYWFEFRQYIKEWTLKQKSYKMCIIHS